MAFTFGQESCGPAFPGTTTTPRISSGLRFPEACRVHCGPGGDLGVSRCYIICSASLARNTDALTQLQAALDGADSDKNGHDDNNNNNNKNNNDDNDKDGNQSTAQDHERVAGVRKGISPHTPLAQVVEVINEIRELNHHHHSSRSNNQADVDCIITLGAGSLTDAAKLVRLGLANGVREEADFTKLHGTSDSNPDFLGDDKVQPPTAIKLVHIPTSLSGGEYQALAGGTESSASSSSSSETGNGGGGGGNKRSFHCAGVNSDLVVLDPELCLTTPDWVWLSTGIRAVDHCVETLCSVLDVRESLQDPNNNNNSNNNATPKPDPWSGLAYAAPAREGLTALVKGLLDSKTDRASLDARRRCQDGVVRAMQAISSGQVKMGASHAIGHQLGPLGVGHGETSCVLLPAVCRYNLAHADDAAAGGGGAGAVAVGDVIRRRQRAVRDVLVGIDEVRQLLRWGGYKEDNMHEAELGDVLYGVVGALGMPQSLEAVKVTADKFDELARQSLQDLWIKTNPIPITEEKQVLEILGMCARHGSAM